MSLPYFPMFPKDFEAKTAHLTLAEDGAYNRLLRLCWMTPGCSLPSDEDWIMRRCRAVTEDDKENVRTVLAEFFTLSRGRYRNAKLAEIFRDANVAHKKRKNAGKKGGAAKAQKSKEKPPSNATAMLKQPEPEPYIEKGDTNVSPKNKRGTRLSQDWALPKEWGEWALAEGWGESQIRSEADKFRDYWHSVAGSKGVKLNWLATWRNWLRNSNTPKQSQFKAINGGRNGKPTSTDPTLDAIAAAARMRRTPGAHRH